MVLFCGIFVEKSCFFAQSMLLLYLIISLYGRLSLSQVCATFYADIHHTLDLERDSFFEERGGANNALFLR